MSEENKKEQNTTKINVEKQEKLKKQSEMATQAEEIKKEDPKKLRDQLSNKNKDYIFRLEKELQKQGSISRDEAVAMTDGLLSEIIIAQRHGQLANGLYLASPAIKAEQMLHPKKKPVATPTWQLMIDGALLYLAIFFALFGIVALFETKNQPYNSQWGVLTLASIGIMMGAFMVKYNDWMMPNQGKRMPWGKMILRLVAIVVVLFVWMWILSIPALRVINPVLPGAADIVIAAIAYGARCFFRRHYNIVGSTFAPRPREHE